MEGLYTSLSGGMFMEQRLQVLSNDIANLNTPGHKRSRVMLESHFPTVQADLIHQSDPRGLDTEAPEVSNMGHRTLNRLGGMETDFSQGQIRTSGQALDLAIEGEGFFVIESNGVEQFTRNGAFALDLDGQMAMITENGFLPVLGEGGPIRLNNTDVEISEDGTIRDSEGIDLGRVRVVRFENPQRLQRIGNSLYGNPDDVAQAVDADPSDQRIRQNSLEMSNANPMFALVEMIELQRSHQAISKMMTTIDQVVSQRISTAMDR